MAGTFAAFLLSLSMVESGGNYQSVNTLNFLGAYQFGEAALTDLGFVRYDGDAFDNDYSGGWTGKYGVHSKRGFLRSERAQDRAAEDWMRLMWSYIKRDRTDRYAWKMVGQTRLTTSGMLAAAHLLGTGALKDYIESNGTLDLRDPYGTPIVQYIHNFSDYDVPFAPDEPTPS